MVGILSETGLIKPKKEAENKLRTEFSKAVLDISNTYLSDRPKRGDADLSDYYLLSRITLGDYVTLDWQHRLDILRLIDSIRDYAQDHSRKRPLNILMQAEPGSGKSHFIKCLAKAMRSLRIKEVIFNMACMQNIEDFVPPLDALRNLKVNDNLPLLFLDEFDAKDRFFSLLLPLLWDGELQVGHRDLKLGKSVIILAGSSPDIRDAIISSRNIKSKEFDSKFKKLADLLSRINSCEISIPGLDEISKKRNRRVDKICIAVALLEYRFGKDLTRIPWPLLSFIALSKFRYGVRSITHLIDLIPMIGKNAEVLSLSDLHLPLNSESELQKSSLAFHMIDENGPASIIALWEKLRQSKSQVEIKKETTRKYFWDF